MTHLFDRTDYPTLDCFFCTVDQWSHFNFSPAACGCFRYLIFTCLFRIKNGSVHCLNHRPEGVPQSPKNLCSSRSLDAFWIWGAERKPKFAHCPPGPGVPSQTWLFVHSSGFFRCSLWCQLCSFFEHKVHPEAELTSMQAGVRVSAAPPSYFLVPAGPAS